MRAKRTPLRQAHDDPRIFVEVYRKQNRRQTKPTGGFTNANKAMVPIQDHLDRRRRSLNRDLRSDRSSPSAAACSIMGSYDPRISRIIWTAHSRHKDWIKEKGVTMPKQEDRKPRSGTIRCSWAVCPDNLCSSRDFGYWDIEFEQDEFWCGTCELILQKPIFCLPKNGRKKH